MRSNNARVSRFDRWIEFASAVLLALATILTAWCGYQAARWGGEQAAGYSKAGGARTQAAQQTNQAMLRISTQVGLFTEYLSAKSQGNQAFADFLYGRFTPELRAATDDWLKTDPFTNPNAPRSPFDMPAYSVPEQAEAQRLEQRAQTYAAAAEEANELADRYVLLTVIFATVLFFGGISGKFQWQVVDMIVMGFGVAVLLLGLAILLSSPVR
jgi:hypothetical protein